jgi:hypothetical protein
MLDTPIHINGPFTLATLHASGAHVICGRDGVPICELTGQLIDGSGRKEKYPDGFIRTRQARKEEAEFVLRALNFYFENFTS